MEKKLLKKLFGFGRDVAPATRLNFDFHLVLRGFGSLTCAPVSYLARCGEWFVFSRGNCASVIH